jgi:predicted glycoside hydrolase/deacetylase ChbG (UPF0249 family)
MVVITADDYGKNVHATDSILKCFESQRITSASAMVFMEDSERAAILASQTKLEVGLHLNFTMLFNAVNVSPKIVSYQKKVVSYLTRNKLGQVIYNPLLADSFKFLFLSQQEEFMRLYGRQPAFYNGHHHMHLCANMLIGKILPEGECVRRTFTFYKSEKNIFNRFYRYILDSFVIKRFSSTDSFFSILPLQNQKRLKDILNRSTISDIEIEVHPENSEEIKFLLSDQFNQLINSIHTGTFQQIKKGENTPL